MKEGMSCGKRFWRSEMKEKEEKELFIVRERRKERRQRRTEPCREHE